VGAALAGQEEGELMGKLVLYLPDGTLHDIPLDKERLSIGRRPDNDICLPYPAVSGEHAAVVTILADSFLEDLGSTNGTLVNGKPVVKHFLRDHDLIDIGRQRLLYFSDVEARAEPLPPDVLRREVRGLHEQVERARTERIRGDQAPIRMAPPIDPLMPDDELLADIEAAALPGGDLPSGPIQGTLPERAVQRPPSAGTRPGSPAPARSPDPSSVAGRLAATWSSEAPPNDAAASSIARRSAIGGGAPSDSAGPAAELPVVAGYRIRVLSGPSTGRELVLTPGEFSIGRVGTQVARIAGQEGAWSLSLVEGPEPVLLNGQPVPADGQPMTPGDRFRVAGVDLAFERV
jgi:hypothetical protein